MRCKCLLQREGDIQHSDLVFSLVMMTPVLVLQRAGRDGKPATVYSFFTRNLQTLADSVIQLLERSKQHVDPNLRLLTQEGKPSKRPRKTMQQREPPARPADDGDTKQESDGDDSFAMLAPGRIALKRSANVSDASSASSSSEDDDEEDTGGEAC